MGFDYNFPGPIQSLERFLRILKYDQNRTVYDMSYQICKFQLNDSMFLEYRPSQIAACSAIIAINIFERDQMEAAKQGSKPSSRKSNSKKPRTKSDKMSNSKNSKMKNHKCRPNTRRWRCASPSKS